MSDYSAVAPPQNFNKSQAFAAALLRAKQIAAKINPSGSGDGGTKRSLEDGSEPDAKKLAGGVRRDDSSSVVGGGSGGSQGSGGGSVGGRVASAAPGGSGPGGAAGPPGSAGSAPPSGPAPPTAQPAIPGLPVPGLGIGPVTSEDIKVPDKMVGLIIGRGGEQITRLQSDSGCKIQMAPDSGGLPDRVCTLTGNATSINRAKELINAIVHQRYKTEGPGPRGMDDMMQTQHNNPSFVEVMIPGPKVGLIIGKGGETIKTLQEKSGAKMVVIQEGPNQEAEKPLRITGDPQKVEHAKTLVYELLAEKENQQRRDHDRGRGGQGGGRGGYNDRAGGGPGGGGGPPGSGGTGGRGYNDRRGSDESTYVVPASKCGVIIGRGGETIKQINQQTGAHCELDRRPGNNPNEKIFIIRGTPEQIDAAKQMISDKLGGLMQGPGGGGMGPNANGYGGGPGGPPQYGQNWAAPAAYQQPYHTQMDPCGGMPQMNTQTGQPDYSAQWIEYYRSLGMHSEADTIEQQTKAKAAAGAVGGGSGQGGGQGGSGGGGGGGVGGGGGGAGSGPGVPAGGPAQQNGQPDYSAQWAQYYRSIGKIKEAEIIEQQMKSKGGVPGGGSSGMAQGGAGSQGGFGGAGGGGAPAPGGGYYPTGPTAPSAPFYPQQPYQYPTAGYQYPQPQQQQQQPDAP